MNFLIRSALNIAGLYCFYLLNEVVWYPNFFIAVSFVVTGIYCFKKANDGTFSSESNKKKILPDRNLKKLGGENKYRNNVKNTFTSTFRKKMDVYMMLLVSKDSLFLLLYSYGFIKL